MQDQDSGKKTEKKMENGTQTLYDLETERSPEKLKK